MYQHVITELSESFINQENAVLLQQRAKLQEDLENVRTRLHRAHRELVVQRTTLRRHENLVEQLLTDRANAEHRAEREATEKAVYRDTLRRIFQAEPLIFQYHRNGLTEADLLDSDGTAYDSELTESDVEEEDGDGLANM